MGLDHSHPPEYGISVESMSTGIYFLMGENIGTTTTGTLPGSSIYQLRDAYA